MATYTIGRVGIVAKGAYSASTPYAALDMVTYQDSSYIAKLPTTGNAPTNGAYWMQAAQGAYTSAVAGGYSGTQAQFNADLAAMDTLATQLASI